MWRIVSRMARGVKLYQIEFGFFIFFVVFPLQRTLRKRVSKSDFSFSFPWTWMLHVAACDCSTASLIPNKCFDSYRYGLSEWWSQKVSLHSTWIVLRTLNRSRALEVAPQTPKQTTTSPSTTNECLPSSNTLLLSPSGIMSQRRSLWCSVNILPWCGAVVWSQSSLCG